MEIWLCIPRWVPFNLSLNMVLMQFSLVRKKTKGRQRENQNVGWGKLLGGREEKGCKQLRQKSMLVILDELLGIQKPLWPLRNFPKILIFRDVQYTDFLLQDICEGQCTLQAHSRRTPPPCWSLTWHCSWGTNSSQQRSAATHPSPSLGLLGGAELHFLLFLWLLSEGLYLYGASEW